MLSFASGASDQNVPIERCAILLAVAPVDVTPICDTAASVSAESSIRRDVGAYAEF